MTRTLRVLLVEDREDDAELTLRELQRSDRELEWLRVETAEAMAAALAEREWDVVISDWSLPTFDGSRALALLAETGLDIPFILVSGTIGEELAAEVMRAGAHDFVLKQRLVRLGPAVDREVREAEDRAARRATEAALLRSEMELRHAQKMEAVGRLAGGIAHDFNNLLSVMLAGADLALLDLDETHPATEQLVDIRAAAQRAAVLTRQLLAFSRRQILQPKPVDLDEVVRGTEQLLHRLIGEDIELVLRLDGDLPAVQLDAGQIGQVLMNLAVNSRDAMPRGGTLTLATETVVLDAEYCRMHPRTSPGTYVTLSVVDTGCGMDAATLEHAFEPFYTTKPIDRGTGLGLSTVLGIVEQSGGAIELDSEPDRGTTVRMIFRALPDALAHVEPSVGHTPLPGGTETVLLVEDDDAVRTMIRTVLGRLGYTVYVAARGEEALAVFENHADAIELLIADVVMPRMSGRELAERLRVRRPSLHVLYISGYNDDDVLRHGVLQDEVALLLKPFSPHALATRVREVLDDAPPE